MRVPSPACIGHDAFGVGQTRQLDNLVDATVMLATNLSPVAHLREKTPGVSQGSGQPLREPVAMCGGHRIPRRLG